jgi:cell division initiation protein
MDASQSALDSLRTVEFRETLKGYHRDDVDEYLEKAAVEAEGLQEQLRQGGERLRQAAERIAQLEARIEDLTRQLAAAPADAAPAPPATGGPVVTDDTLQRTLLLAQKFVDETKADSEAQASKLLADAETKARAITENAQTQATRLAAEAEQRLREEIGRLESTRSSLSADVEAMTNHLQGERDRIRAALGDMLRWVDGNLGGGQNRPAAKPEPAASPAGGPSTGQVAAVRTEGNRPAAGAPGGSGAKAAPAGGAGEGGQPLPAGTAVASGSVSTGPLPV